MDEATTAESIYDPDSHTTYYPILGGWRAERDGQVEYIYLNPSGGSDDGVATVFLYQGTQGDPGQDSAVVHVVVFEDEGAKGAGTNG